MFIFPDAYQSMNDLPRTQAPLSRKHIISYPFVTRQMYLTPWILLCDNMKIDTET